MLEYYAKYNDTLNDKILELKVIYLYQLIVKKNKNN